MLVKLRDCQRAGMTPTVVELDGQDPVAYIVSANINRRHLTKSQRAMAVAKLFPEPEKGGRGKNSVLNTDFSQAQVSHARTVLKWTPGLGRRCACRSQAAQRSLRRSPVRQSQPRLFAFANGAAER